MSDFQILSGALGALWVVTIALAGWIGNSFNNNLRRIWKKLDEICPSVASMGSTVNGVRQRLDRIEGRVDRHIEESAEQKRHGE